jgi:hypothetical protein
MTGMEEATPRLLKPNFSIRIQYKGEEQTIELSLPEPIIFRLAQEADLRHLRVEEFVCKLIIKTLKKNLLKLVLDPQSPVDSGLSPPSSKHVWPQARLGVGASPKRTESRLPWPGKYKGPGSSF